MTVVELKKRTKEVQRLKENMKIQENDLVKLREGCEAIIELPNHEAPVPAIFVLESGSVGIAFRKYSYYTCLSIKKKNKWNVRFQISRNFYILAKLDESQLIFEDRKGAKNREDWI